MNSNEFQVLMRVLDIVDRSVISRSRVIDEAAPVAPSEKLEPTKKKPKLHDPYLSPEEEDKIEMSVNQFLGVYDKSEATD